MLYQTIGYICVSMIIIYAIRFAYQYIQQSCTTPKTVNLVKIYEQKYNRLLEDRLRANIPALRMEQREDLDDSTNFDQFQQTMRESLRQLVRESETI
jgi:biopolymer transport protein ExbB/TolQ